MMNIKNKVKNRIKNKIKNQFKVKIKLYKCKYDKIILTLLFIMLLFSHAGINFGTSNQLDIDNPDIYNPISLNIIPYNGGIEFSYAGYVINDTDEWLLGFFYVDGNVNVSLPIFVVWSVTIFSGVPNVTLLSSIGSSKTDNSEIMSSTNIESNVPIVVFNSPVVSLGNVVRRVNVSDFENFDLLSFTIKTNSPSVPVIVHSATIYYGVEQMNVNISIESGLQNYEWYMIFQFIIMILNLIVIKTVYKTFKQMRLVFFIIGLVYGGMGLLYTNTPTYPFLQILMIMYSFILNFPLQSNKNK